MEFLDKLLTHFNLTKEEYEKLSLPLDEVHLIDPDSIEGMAKTKSRILKAIENKEKIIVYGDYDCDGICATSIMAKTFQLMGYPVSYYIPSRYIDGYGLNVNNVMKIASSGYKLIITVDNGISAHEAIDKANELGIDVIVVDHHEVPPESVKAHSIIHPIVSHISEIVGSGGYMSLFVSSSLLGRYEPYLVTLAGLSTISDLMELKGYNRDVVRLAIHYFEKYQYLPLRYLLDNEIINEKSFSLGIAPKINAIGRMKEDTSVNRLVKYLTSEDENEIYALSQWILEVNEERKSFTKEAVDTLPLQSDEAGICLLTDMKEGLIGLIANRLLNEYNVPTIIFTEDGNDPAIIKGSIRSKEGFNVTKAFESLDKYLITGGGHAMAGGLSIKKDDFEAFRSDFKKLAERYSLVEEKEDTIEISISDISIANYEILRSLAPFGMGFKEPTFEIKNLPTRGLTFISFGKHLSTKLTMNTKLLGFNMNEGEIKAHSTISIIGNFNLSEFKGYQTLEFKINKYN
jgi:single-stranded-DNA-specific exonuclease